MASLSLRDFFALSLYPSSLHPSSILGIHQKIHTQFYTYELDPGTCIYACIYAYIYTHLCIGSLDMIWYDVI